MMAGFIALIVPGIYLMCRISVATPAALLEDKGPSDSIRRSFDLTRDFAGRAFMIYMLYFTMVWGIVAVFQFPFLLLIAFNAKQTQLCDSVDGPHASGKLHWQRSRGAGQHDRLRIVLL